MWQPSLYTVSTKNATLSRRILHAHDLSQSLAGRPRLVWAGLCVWTWRWAPREGDDGKLRKNKGCLNGSSLTEAGFPRSLNLNTHITMPPRKTSNKKGQAKEAGPSSAPALPAAPSVNFPEISEKDWMEVETFLEDQIILIKVKHAHAERMLTYIWP